MLRAPHHLASKRLALGAGGLLLAFGTPAGASERQVSAPAISVAAPAGFDGLEETQRTVVEVFAGGSSLGAAEVRIKAGTIRFLNPQALLSQIPSLADPALVARYLSAEGISSNSGLVCRNDQGPADCGTLSPQIAGVIYDANQLRVDLFVNPGLLSAPRLENEYLPSPENSFSLLGLTSAVVSGSGSDRLVNLQENLVASVGASRLRADFAIATDLGFQADRLFAERDLDGLRVSAGAMWSPGSALRSRQKFLGLGLESQTDTRRDRLQIEGSPLVVFLDERSRVEVLREDKIIASGVYSPGNQVLDTSGMPEGSYDLTIRIHNSRGGVREEKRLFTKQASIVVEGFDRFRVQAGLAIDERSAGSLRPSSARFLEASWARRLSENLAVDATLDWSHGRFTGEVGAYVLSPFAVVRLAAIGSDGAIQGGILQARSNGVSPLNFSVDVRHWVNGGVGHGPDPSGQNASASADASVPAPRSRAEITQLAGNLSFSLPQAQLFVSGTFAAGAGSEPETYSVGPSVRWRLFERGRLRLLFDGNVSLTDRGRAGFAGLSLTLRGGRSSTSVQMGQGYASGTMQDGRRGTFVNLDQSLQVAGFAGGDLALAGFAQRSLEGELLGASGDFRNEAMSLSAEAIGSAGDGRNSLQYTLGGRAGFFVGSGEAGIAADIRTESMAVVRIAGARPSDVFEVFVDQSKAGSIAGSESVSLTLPSYRSYSIRIKHAGPGSVAYDGRAREVTVFPGQITPVLWTVAPTALVYGRLIGADGLPAAYASISTQGAWGETDANGYFQLEAASGAELAIQLPGGGAVARTLPQFAADAATIKLGDLRCCAKGGSGQIAVQTYE